MENDVANPSLLKDIDGFESTLPMILENTSSYLLLIFLATIIVTIIVYFRQTLLSNSWQSSAKNELSELQQRLSHDNLNNILSDLSVLLRRIVMMKYQRIQCAGLYGDDWLKWLNQHDPKGFDWLNNGQLLIKEAYSGQQSLIKKNELKQLLTATQKLIN